MQGDGWIRVPVRSEGLVPIGIGSAKITAEGEIEIILPSGKYFGQYLYQKAQEGWLDYLLIKPMLKEPEGGSDIP